MKKLIILFSLFGITACLAMGDRAKLSVKVIEENGRPLPDAEVKVWFFDEQTNSGFSDTNGVFSATGNPPTADVSYSVKKKGYYPHRDEYKFSWTYSPEDRCEPWNLTNTVFLKEIKTPIPMFVKRAKELLPKPNQAFGYDVEKGSLVPPYGDGVVSDFVFKVEGYYAGKKDYDGTLTLTFSNKKDGIQSFEKNLTKGSVLHSAHKAPQTGYFPEWTWRKSRRQTEGQAEITDTRSDDRSYYFRVRTVLDENGNIKSALYGKIYGELNFGGASDEGSFLKIPIYYLNPTPNDRNVEFDPDKNLFGGRDRFAP